MFGKLNQNCLAININEKIKSGMTSSVMLLYRRLYDDLYYAIFFAQMVTRYEENEKHQTAKVFENGR